MEAILDTIRPELGGVIAIGFHLAGFFFLLACLFNYVVTLQGKANWTRLLTNLVIVFILLSQYVWIMDISKELVEGVQAEVTSNKTYLTQYVEMVDNFREVYEKNQGDVEGAIKGYFP